MRSPVARRPARGSRRCSRLGLKARADIGRTGAQEDGRRSGRPTEPGGPGELTPERPTDRHVGQRDDLSVPERARLLVRDGGVRAVAAAHREWGAIDVVFAVAVRAVVLVLRRHPSCDATALSAKEMQKRILITVHDPAGESIAVFWPHPQ